MQDINDNAIGVYVPLMAKIQEFAVAIGTCADNHGDIPPEQVGWLNVQNAQKALMYLTDAASVLRISAGAPQPPQTAKPPKQTVDDLAERLRKIQQAIESELNVAFCTQCGESFRVRWINEHLGEQYLRGSDDGVVLTDSGALCTDCAHERVRSLPTTHISNYDGQFWEELAYWLTSNYRLRARFRDQLDLRPAWYDRLRKMMK